MGRKLARTVTVDGKQYPAGSTPPAEVADKIRTRSAWGPDEVTTSQEPDGDDQGGGDPSDGDDDPAAGTQPQGGDEPPGDDSNDGEDGEDEGSSDTDPLEEPPRRGRGATDAAWRKHAQALGVAVDPDAGRDDVQALLVERGLIDPS